MNMSKVPHTLDYQIDQLKGKLQVIDEALVEHKSDHENILNFEWVRNKRQRHQVEEDLKSLVELLLPSSPDPTTFA